MFFFFTLDEPALTFRNGRCRSSQQLAGAVVVPSEEDGQTFSVNFASGEVKINLSSNLSNRFVDQVFKLRASHTKERQIWVDRVRACAHRHNLVG